MTYRLDALARDLEGIHTALLDTSTCVYFLSEAQPWLTVVRAVLERADRGSLQLFIPSIVQMELLVRPFKSNDELERRKVETFVERTPFVRPVPFDRHVMMASAEIRGRLGLKLADAIVVGSACRAGSDAVIGNDARFRALNGQVAFQLVTAPTPGLPRYIHIDDYIDEEPQKD